VISFCPRPLWRREGRKEGRTEPPKPARKDQGLQHAEANSRKDFFLLKSFFALFLIGQNQSPDGKKKSFRLVKMVFTIVSRVVPLPADSCPGGKNVIPPGTLLNVGVGTATKRTSWGSVTQSLPTSAKRWSRFCLTSE
jgi:hypothetical protein